MSALAALRLSSCRLRRFTMSGGVGNQSDYTSQPASEFHADALSVQVRIRIGKCDDDVTDAD